MKKKIEKLKLEFNLMIHPYSNNELHGFASEKDVRAFMLKINEIIDYLNKKKGE